MAEHGGRASKRRRLDYRDTITVLAGNGSNGIETRFTAHIEIVTQSSGFFQNACSGNFKELEEGVVRLPEINPTVFKSYMHWVYSDQVVVDDEDNDSPGSRILLHTELYVAVDMLDNTRLRNATIDSLLALCDTDYALPASTAISYVYGHLPDTSLLRTLFVDYFLHATCPGWVKTNSPMLPRQFLEDLLFKRMVNKNEKTTRPSYECRCAYHEHDERAPKCR